MTSPCNTPKSVKDKSNTILASSCNTVSNASDKPCTVDQLPDEALDLAARIFDMARHGDSEQLVAYLDAGIPVNLTDSKGNSLLMLAAYNGHASTVLRLIERGADVNMLNERNQSILAGAVFKGYNCITELLWNSGARADLGHPTALDCAHMFKQDFCIQLFTRETVKSQSQ